jgi:protein involved in polysaccharide export with SLBB domain
LLPPKRESDQIVAKEVPMSRAHVRTVSCILAVLLASPAVARAQETPVGAAEVMLKPGDVLQITVWPDATLGGSFVVEETGLVYLPFLGAVQTGGVSIDRLRNQLREDYAEILKEPVVTIVPLFNIGVSGGVRRPGIYQITPAQNILDVILEAGGFAERAKRDQVQIVREGQLLMYNVQRALEGAANLEAFTLRSGDQIVGPVGSSFGITNILQLLTLASTIILLVERTTN